jgi:uncharacterized protein YgbK (DUF1537 family)
MKAALIADDLTGANNAGVLLLKQDLATITVTYENPSFPETCDAICIDTDSRYLPQEEAKRRVNAAARWACEHGAEILCNRVDNLLRGNIGAEIDGILSYLGRRAMAVVVPAFPALKRCVVDGYLLVDGSPVHEHPVASNDPISPVKQSFIPDIIAEQLDAPVSLVGLDNVAAGAERLAARLEADAGAGTRIVVVDSSRDEHLRTVAQAMAKLDRVLVAVDPGVLSAAYLKTYREKIKPAGRGKKVIISLGSVTSLSLRQFDYLISKWGIKAVRLDPSCLIGRRRKRDGEIKRAIREGLRRLETSSVIALTTFYPGDTPLDLESLAKTKGISPHMLSKRISDGLAEATCEVIKSSNGMIGGCFPSGGDVTASLFKVAETKAIKILGNVIPLTAHVEFSGGFLEGLRLVTKGGSIGDEDAMDTCLNFLVQELG